MARRCGIPHPPTPTSVSARSLGGSAAHPALRGRFGPATGHPASARCGGAACTRPGRGVWLARRGGARSGSPERRRRRRGLLRHRGTVSAPQPARPPALSPSRAAHRGRRHCPRLPARSPARPPARHADLCSRGRRLRFARSSSEGGSALAQPSSRRLSFSARRRRSGEGSAPDPPRAAQGARAGRAGGAGRRGAARAHQPSALARPAGSSGSPGSRRAPRTPGLWPRPPCPTAARTGASAARAAAAAATAAAARGRREEPQGSGRTGGGPPRPLPHGVSGALLQLTFKEAREQPQQQQKKSQETFAGSRDQIPQPTQAASSVVAAGRVKGLQMGRVTTPQRGGDRK